MSSSNFRDITVDTSSPVNSGNPPVNGRVHRSLFSTLVTLLALVTVNPFADIKSGDFSGETRPWTLDFFGATDSYSFPHSSPEARGRVRRSVKVYARNYATLFLVFFGCALYQMPITLVGSLLCFAFLSAVKSCGDRLGWDRFPTVKSTVVRVATCAGVIVLVYFRVHVAVFFAMVFGYGFMVLHGFFKKVETHLS